MCIAPIGTDESFKTDSPEIVQCFLDTIREYLRSDCENLHVHKRDKNNAFKKRYRYTDYDIHDIVRDLGVWNYYRTIEKMNCPDALEFGYSDDGLEIYLKLSLKEVGGYYVLNVEVISFHDPELTIQYPYADLKPQRRGNNA